MENKTADIRNIINLLESAAGPSIDMITEAFRMNEGWLSNFSKKMKRKLGAKELKAMAGRLEDEWHTWLGQVDRTGDLDDMKRFMLLRIGFNDDDIDEVLSHPTSPVKDKITTNDVEDEDEMPRQRIKRGDEITDEPDAEDIDSDEVVDEPASDDSVDEPSDDSLSSAIRKAQAKARRSRQGPNADAADIKVDQEPADNEVEMGEVVDDPKKYMKDGKIDPQKVAAKLRTMPIGDKLTLGSRSFFMGPAESGPKPQWNPDRKKRNEGYSIDLSSLYETYLYELEENSPILSDDEVEEILHLAAAHVNDQYLLNGPQNDARYAAQDARTGRYGSRTASGARRTSTGTIATNPGGSAPAGQYDSKEMWDVLAQNGFTKGRYKNLESKIANSKSVADMTDEEMQEIAMIGYALIRSRT